MLSILSVSAINAKTRMKTYAVYYICGMKWYHVVTIEVIKSSIIVLLAGIISLIFCNIEKNKILFGKLLIDTGLKQMICCFITGLIFIAASAIIPRIMIGREKPVTTFHRN